MSDSNYINFLFSDTGELKSRYAPVISYVPESDSFILKYSIPGYHSPRQYFKFGFEILSEPVYPNFYVSEIFRIFSITSSFLFRRPKSKTPSFKISIIAEHFKIQKQVSPEDFEIATYNLNLAIQLGRQSHSLFYFDSYLEAYKILNPNIKYTSSVVKKLQAEFNRIISI